MSDEHDDRPSGADVKTWILGALWAISMTLAGFVGTSFNSRLDRLEEADRARGERVAELAVRVGTSASSVDNIGPRLDDMSQKLATLTAQVQGLRADLDRSERGSRSLGR